VSGSHQNNEQPDPTYCVEKVQEQNFEFFFGVDLPFADALIAPYRGIAEVDFSEPRTKQSASEFFNTIDPKLPFDCAN
jgi:hypothetical protein